MNRLKTFPHQFRLIFVICLSIFVLTSVARAATAAQLGPDHEYAMADENSALVSPARSLEKFNANASVNYIVINAAGFTPADQTIRVGETVTWHNATASTYTLKSGVPSVANSISVFLPLVAVQGIESATKRMAALREHFVAAGAGEFEQVLAPGDDFSYTYDGAGSFPYHLVNADKYVGNVVVEVPGPTAFIASSPNDGEGDVAVTRETIIEFDGEIAPTSVTKANFSASFGGKPLAARLQQSADGRRVTLFYKESLPASGRIYVKINGDGITDASGKKVDADGDGKPGGERELTFDTLSLTVVPGTSVCGRVFASELKKVEASNVSVNNPLGGVTITVDAMEDTLRTTTDANGNFCLDPAPAGRFFVHIDGRTASNGVPNGAYHPFVGKAWESVIGQQSSVGDVFLPLVEPGTLQAVSASKETRITFAPAVTAEFPELVGTEILVPAGSLFADNGDRGGKVGVSPVPPDRLPGKLPPFLNFPIVITVQTDGATNFDVPAPICFPNLPDPQSGATLAPGAKSALWSFNHDSGRFDMIGPMTVSDDGELVCTDPGVGVPAPGWHATQPSSTGKGKPPKTEQEVIMAVPPVSIIGIFKVALEWWNLPKQSGASLIEVPVEKPYMYAVESRGFIQRGWSLNQGAMNVVLPENAEYTLAIYEPRGRLFGSASGESDSSGQEFDLMMPLLKDATGQVDSDGDGLGDEVEFVIGTKSSQADTDKDGVGDGVEVDRGTDPLDGIVARTGHIATADTPGNALDLCAMNNLVAVADGDAGMALFNIFNGMNPSIINQIDTPGNAVDIACAHRWVAVADSASGIAASLAWPPLEARIDRQIDVGSAVHKIALMGDQVFAGADGGVVVLVDLLTGSETDRVKVGNQIVDMAMVGDILYVLTDTSLVTVPATESPLKVADQVTTDRYNVGLFIGLDIGYVVHDEGYDTYSLSDPAQPKLVGADSQPGGSLNSFVTNDNDLGVAAARLGAGLGISVYDIGDPTKTNELLASFDTPGQAAAARLYGGLAYVADGSAGMQVVSYLAAEQGDVAPAAALTTNFAPGVAEANSPMRLSVNARDDVQMQIVAFYLNGILVALDGAYPFEIWIATPDLADAQTFTIQAEATDTGGNSTLTPEQTVTLVSDATPPRVLSTEPKAEGFVTPNSLTEVTATFSEPMKAATINGANIQLYAAGADEQVGTGDDQPVSVAVTYDADNRVVKMTAAAPLANGQYRAAIGAAVADVAGNALKQGDYAWTFLVGAVRWDGGGDNSSWHDPLNWHPDGVPGVGANITVDDPAQAPIVYSQGESTIGSIESNRPLKIGGGALYIEEASTLSDLDLATGKLGGSGTVTVNGKLTWTYGVMAGPGKTIALGSVLLGSTDGFSGSPSMDGRTVDVVGTADWRSGNISLYGGAALNILPGATFNDLNTSLNEIVIYNDINTGNLDGSFTNEGVFTKKGSDWTRISAIDNKGTLNVQAGKLLLTGKGSNRGAIKIASGAEFELEYSELTLNAGATIAGAGQSNVSGGTLIVSGDSTIKNLLLEEKLGNLGIIEGSGLLTILDTFTWKSGVLRGPGVTTVEGALMMPGKHSGFNSDPLLDGRTLNNAGVATWSGGTYGMDNGAVFNNLSGATFNDTQTDDETFEFLGNGARSAFNNSGTYNKTGNSDTWMESVLTNSGTFNLQAGELELADDGANSGAINISSGTTFWVNAGLFENQSGGVMDIDAGGWIAVYGTLKNLAGALITGNGTLDASGGAFQNDGTVDPSVTVF